MILLLIFCGFTLLFMFLLYKTVGLIMNQTPRGKGLEELEDIEKRKN